jgi:fructokinase
MKYYGALEAGGTKMVMAVMDAEGNPVAESTIPTRTPEETMPEMMAFFSAHPISALGIGGFGPLNLDPRSDRYGWIMETPKTAWRYYPLKPAFEEKLGVPVGIDTDVNAAALAEARLGAAKGKESCLYVTVGTGIGGGVIVHGKPVHGLMHPEIGHITVAPMPDDPMPEGVCPYHPHCLESLASGPSIQKRWGMSARELPEGHPAWELESAYLAQLCANALLTFSPEKIVLGGGVMQRKFLLPLIRRKTLKLLNGYIAHPAVEAGLEDYIVTPGLGTRSGITGAWLLALDAEK